MLNLMHFNIPYYHSNTMTRLASSFNFTSSNTSYMAAAAKGNLFSLSLMLLQDVHTLEITLAAMVFIAIHSLRSKKNHGLPNWPFLGMLPSLVSGLRTNMYEWITDVLKHQNGTFSFKGPWFTSLNCIITSDPRNLEHLLKTKFTNFPKGKYFRDTVCDLLGDGVFSADDETWQRQRKTASIEFHSTKFRKLTTESLFELVHKRLLPVLEESVEKSVSIDLQDVLLRLTFDNVCMIAFGVDPGCSQPNLPEIPFATAFEDATEATLLRFVTPVCIWKAMRFLNLGVERKLKRSIEKVDEFAVNVIRTRKKELSLQLDEGNKQKSDLLTVFMRLKDENGKPYSDKFLRDICVNFILAGRDTSSVALSWFFWLLDQNPQVEERILEEICRVVSQREEELDENSLTFRHKDIQQQLAVPNWNQPIKLPGYMARLPRAPSEAHLEQIVRLILESKKPVLYVGGGSLNSSEELRRFVQLTGVPVASTLMGLGSYPTADENSLQMLGMHGTVYANYAVDKSDLLLAFGVRFDDRVTGKLEAFASRAKIVHIDIDSAEIGKNKQPHVSVCADLKLALRGINSILESKGVKGKLDFRAWREELNEQKQRFPLSYKTFEEAIPPQYAIQVLDELTNGNAIISTGVGQHQMWAAQFYKYKRPRQWLTSGGLGAMGFGLPAAIGAAVANPGAVVVDIDGDGSFIMNVQELATIKVENLPVKVLLLNNQHLGMVVQWEDRFYKSNRAHTYLGNPSNETEVFPNMLKFADACGIPAARVTKKEDLRAAIQKMLDTPGPYLLDVIVPHQEHVLPMIPSNGTFQDVITEGDGRISY